MNLKNSILLLSLSGMLVIAACKKDNHRSFVTTLPGNYSCAIHHQGEYYAGSSYDSVVYFDSIVGTATISVTRANTSTGVVVNGITFSTVDSVIGNTASYFTTADSSTYYQVLFYNTGDSISFWAFGNSGYYSNNYYYYNNTLYTGHKVQ